MSKWSRFKESCWRRRAFSKGASATLVLQFLAVAATVATLTSCPGASYATAPKSMTLTDQQPSATMEIDPQQIAARPPILELDVLELENPNLVPIGIEVSITDGDTKISVGNFAFYPPDHKGRFSLDCRAAMSRISHSGKAHLVLQLRKLRPSATWQPVRVTVAAPRWRFEKKE